MSSDYVSRAEKVMKDWAGEDRNGKVPMTSSQIRKFLSQVNYVNNQVTMEEMQGKIQEDHLPDSLATAIRSLVVKLVYQAGREKQVKDFLKRSNLKVELEGVGNSLSAFREAYAYIEALVAFHRFYGGKDQ